MTPSTAVEFKRVAASYRDRFEPIELTDRTFEEMLEQAAALPEHTVILVGLFLRDRAGRTYTNAEVAGRVARSASVPVYSALDVHVGRGIVGGYVVRWELQADARGSARASGPPGRAAGTGRRHERGHQCVRVRRPRAQALADRSSAPAPGSVVLFHEPSLWELYTGYVVGAVSLLSSRAGSSESCWCSGPSAAAPSGASPSACGSRPSSSDLSTVLSSCPAAEVDRQVEAGLRRIVEDLGVDRATIWALEDRFRRGPAHAFVDSRRRSGSPTVVQESEAPRDLLPAPSGSCRPPPAGREPARRGSDRPPEPRAVRHAFERRGPPHRARLGGGRPLGRYGSRGAPLARRADSAAPAPRRPSLPTPWHGSARERAAHESAKAHPGPGRTADDRPGGGAPAHRPRAARWGESGPCGAVDRLERARGRPPRGHARRPTPTRSLGSSVAPSRWRSRSGTCRTELHPGILQYTGLAVALRSHCREFEREQGPHGSTFRADDDLGTVPSDVALCLYRVTQEALKNAARHAKASRVLGGRGARQGRSRAHHR